MHDLAPPFRDPAQPLEVVDDDVGRRSLAQVAPVLESGGVRREVAETVVSFLEAQAPLVANEPGEEVGGVGARGQELRVGTTIGDTGQRVRGLDQLGGVVRVV